MKPKNLILIYVGSLFISLLPFLLFSISKDAIPYCIALFASACTVISSISTSYMYHDFLPIKLEKSKPDYTKHSDFIQAISIGSTKLLHAYTDLGEDRISYGKFNELSENIKNDVLSKLFICDLKDKWEYFLNATITKAECINTLNLKGENKHNLLKSQIQSLKGMYKDLLDDIRFFNRIQ